MDKAHLKLYKNLLLFIILTGNDSNIDDLSYELYDRFDFDVAYTSNNKIVVVKFGTDFSYPDSLQYITGEIEAWEFEVTVERVGC